MPKTPEVSAKEAFPIKRIGHLYDDLLDKNKIKEIILLAAKHKRKRREVARVLENIDEYTDKIYEMLETGNITLGETHHREIREHGKSRMLTISPFYPNRILDYCMVETLKPYIRRGMYQYCVGNVDKRGIRAGKKAVLRHCRRYKYYIKLDIRKFYPSVSSQRMIAFAESRIKDKRFMNLCRVMLSGSDDLPIGSYYSQWFSNWFLQDLDHYVKEALKVPFYVRYVDDMVLMGNNKRKLLNAMYCVNRFLETKGLELKHFEQVKQIASAPVDFLGFRFGAGGAKLRTRNFKLLNRRLRRVRKFGHICVSQARCLLAYIAWLRETQSGYSFYLRHMRGVASKGKLRRVVSQYERGHVLQCV